MNVLELSEQEIVRRNSLAELRKMGIEPYPAEEYVVTGHTKEIKENFKDDAEPREVRIAGRIMSRRIMGKASFMELQDSEGRIQVYISRDDLCPGEDKDTYNIFFKKLLDIGDIVGIEGFVFRTQMGEITVHAKNIKMLSKSLRPLPIVKMKDGKAYDAFEDPELRYRQRYVDLIVNDGVKDIFLQRATVLRTLRSVLDEAGYTEVETPTLQSIAGGASARPFITHFNALDVDMYMRIATELYLKRLIVGGFEGVYEIGKNFRNEGMDRNHNPEFTCMELYVQYKDYNWMMAFTEKLLETVCIAVNGSTERKVGDNVISFKAPYRRLPILDAIKEKTGFDCNGKSEERFELMVNGKELANAYSELNDPIDQEERFVEQMRLADKGDDEAMIIDKDFIRALQYGMPPTSGIGIGIDRLVMLMTGQTTIQEVLFFPQMRPEKVVKRDQEDAYTTLGIPAEWVAPLQKAGYLTVDSLDGANPGKVHQEICGLNKKFKLGLTNPSVDNVAAWIDAVKK